MMRFFIMLLVLLPSLSFAEERWHMVTFGRDGFGLSASREDIDTKSNSPFKDVVYLFNNIGLNYAFRVSSRLQLGLSYQNIHREYRLKSASGKHSSVEIEEQSIGGFFIYNFSSDLNDSWFAGYGYSVHKYNEENSKEFKDEEGKAPFEFDDASSKNEIFVGKRFSLRGFNLDNLAYSPQMSVYYQTHAKDFEDNRIGNGTGATIQPIRFDLLF